MDARLIAVASPIFFVLIFLELWLLRRRGLRAYALHDSIADLSCGIGEQICQVFAFVVELGVYRWIWTHARQHSFSIHSVGAWVLLILLLDLAYYWFHRASHRVNFLWAVHSVHHQSEEYNFTVALRQGWIEPLLIVPFHVPIALLGFPPEMFFLGFTAHTLVQFWPHTRAIGRLPIDGVLNSPANHRCHHAVNPGYLDKNYSGFLIVWDRLFGTWVREGADGAPVYGTVKPLSSFNPLWANVSFWVEMRTLAKKCTRFWDKLSVPLRPPEWRPLELGGPVVIPQVSPATQRRYEVADGGRSRDRYVLFAFAVVLLGQPALTQAPSLGWTAKLVAAVFAIVSLSTIAGLIERRSWARPLELVRLLGFPIVVCCLAPNAWATPVALAVGAALALTHAAAWWWATRTPSVASPLP